MPLTEFQKRKVVELQGYNPDEYTLEDDSYIVPRSAQASPALGSPEGLIPKVAPEQLDTGSNTPTQTFLKSAAQAAPATIAGGIGGGVAMGALEGSALGPWGTLGGGILGALSAAGLTSWLQKQIEPESWQKNVAEAQQEHPIAGTLGSLATLPLGGFNPSPSNLVKAGGGLSKLVTGAPMEINEARNLMNVGMGAALGPIQTGAEGIIRGQMPSVGELMQSAAVGALFNKPNALGRRYGFTPSEPIVSEPTAEMLQKQIQEQIPQQPQLDTGTPQQNISPLSVINQVSSSGVWTPRQGKEVFVPGKSAEESAMDIGRALETGAEVLPRNVAFEEASLPKGTLSKFQRDKLIRSKDTAAAEVQRAEQEREALLKAKAELQRQENAQLASENAAKALDLQQGMGAKFPENRPQPRVVTETGKEIHNDYTGNTEADNLQAQRESAEDLALRRLEGYDDKYSQESSIGTTKPKTALEKENTERIKQENLPTEPTSQWFEFFRRLGLLRNYKTEAGRVVNAKGEEIPGQSLVAQGLKESSVRLNPSKVGADTPAHEAIHVFLSTLRKSPRFRDRQFVEKFDKAVEELPDYQRWKAEREAQGFDATPEEFQATNAGVEAYKRALNLAGETPLKKWTKDFSSYLKTRFGKHADIEDYQRLLNYKLYHDPSFSKLFKTGEGLTPNVGRGVKNSEDNSISDQEMQNWKKYVIQQAQGKARRFIEDAERWTKTIEEAKQYLPPEKAQRIIQERQEMISELGKKLSSEIEGQKLGGTKPIADALNSGNINEVRKALGSVKESQESSIKREQKELFSDKETKAASRFAKMREAIDNPERVREAEIEDIRNAEMKNQEVSNLRLSSLKDFLKNDERWDEEMPYNDRGDKIPIKDVLFNLYSSAKKERLGKAGEDIKGAYNLQNDIERWYNRESKGEKSPLLKAEPIYVLQGVRDRLIDKAYYGNGTDKQMAQRMLPLIEDLVNKMADTARYHANLRGTPNVADIGEKIYEGTSRYQEGSSVPRKENPVNEGNLRYIFNKITSNAEGLEADETPVKVAVKDFSDIVDKYDWSKLPRIEQFLHNEMKPESHLSWMAFKRLLVGKVAELKNVPPTAEPTPKVEVEKKPTAQTPEVTPKASEEVSPMPAKIELGQGGEEVNVPKEKTNINVDKDKVSVKYGDREVLFTHEGYEKAVAKARQAYKDVHVAAEPTKEQLNYYIINKTLPEDLRVKSNQTVSAERQLPELNMFEANKMFDELEKVPNPRMAMRQLKLSYNKHVDAARKALREGDVFTHRVEQRNATVIRLQMEHLAEKRDVNVPWHLKLSEESSIGERKNSFLPFLTSRIDKIAEKAQSPTGDMVTEKFHKYEGEADLLHGRIGNKLIAATESYDPKQIQKVYKYLHDVDNFGKSRIVLTPKEQKLADNLVEILREPRREQIAMGLKVRAGHGHREAGIKPEGYMFNVLDPKVAYEWSKNPNSADSKLYDNLFIKHQMEKGLSAKEAKERLDEYKTALGSNVSQDIEFGAIRKAEGNGLPWELVEKNFAAASSRYGKRAANDLAFFKHIQNDERMLQALGIRDQYGNLVKDKFDDVDYIGAMEEVKNAMRSVYHVDTPPNPVITSVARLVNNAVMGVGTAVRNMANMPSFVAQYVQGSQLPLAIKALSNINSSKARAFENNAVRASFANFDAAGYYEGNPNPTIKLMNRFSEYLRKYQGRNFSDKFEGEYYYSLGELLATDNLAKARLGNKESLRFLKKFGDIVEGGGESLLKREITQDDISRIAKRFVDSARGTYNQEGLPSWALEGGLAPFTALSRFSIEKSNTIYKDVIQPLKQGIYGPLLRYTLASMGVGIGIEELNELLTGKRGQDANVKEVLAAGDTEDYVAKAIGLMQLASFAGVVSDGAKLAMNAYQGKSTRYTTPLSFPTYSLAVDTVAGNIADAIGAIKDGENPMEVMGQLATAISTQSVQTMRYADSYFVHPEEAERKEKFRDFRVYKEMTGEKTPEDVSRVNQLEGLEAKKFKRTGDIEEAASMLPDLISKAIEKAEGNPEKLKKELQKLKQNNYQTMPSPETMPLSFLSYLNYLKETQGSEAATERLTDYIKQRTINTAKNEMVPEV